MKITHDVHTHTFQSSTVFDPEASVRNLIAKSTELGHSVLGISNQLWDSNIPTDNKGYKGQPEKYVLEIKHAIPEDTDGVRVLIGAECEYCALIDTFSVTPETAEMFDYILIRHSHTQARGLVIAEDSGALKVRAAIREKLVDGLPELSELLIDRMVGVINVRTVTDANIGNLSEIVSSEYDQLTEIADFLHSSLDRLMSRPDLAEIARKVPTAIIHPFWPDGSSADEARKILSMLDYDRAARQFKACAELGVAVVVNTDAFTLSDNGYKNDPMVKVVRIALDAGCRVVFGTNSNTLAGLEAIRKADEIADAIGITEADIAEFVR